MVTHDVDEAVYLSDRIIVMSAEKGKVLEDITISMERPRNREADAYVKCKEHLTGVLKQALGIKK